MRTRLSDLDQALRAAVGIADADVPRLPRSVLAELAAETVETIAWTYADAPSTVSASGSAVADRSAVAAPRSPLATSGRRRTALATASALAVVTAGTVTAALVSGSAGSAGSSEPNRGSQAVPHPAPSGAARTATEACIRELDAFGSMSPNPGFKLTDAWLSEQRGRTAFTALANSDAFGACLMLDGRGDGSIISYAKHGIPHLSATAIDVAENGSTWTMDGQGKRVDTTVVAGMAGSAVVGLTVLRADGVSVTASLNDGLWAAWWPGDTKAVSVTVDTSGGQHETTSLGQWPSLVPIVPSSTS